MAGSFGKNNKGSIIDLVYIIVGMLVIGMVTLVMFKLVTEFDTNIQANVDIPTEGKDASTSLKGNYTGILDSSALVLVIGLALTSLILASLVAVHPIFIIFYIISLGLVILFSGIFSNIYQEMAATPELATQANELVFITNILTYLPLIIGVFGTILMIVMYKLWTNQQQ